MGRYFAGALLRPHGWVLVSLEECVRMMNE